MTRLIDESFEGTGYEESWTETVGSGCTLDEDSTDVTPPSGGGSQTLKSVSASTGYQAYARRDYGSDLSKTYTRAYVYISAVDATTNWWKAVIVTRRGLVSYPCIIDIEKQSDGNLRFRFRLYNNGTTNTYYSLNINLNTWYRVEFKYDDDANTWEWRIDGSTQDSGSLTGSHHAGIRYWHAGWTTPGTQKTGTIYVDLYCVDDADWPGAEAPETLQINVAECIDAQESLH